jgi:hypothetical protein
VPSAGANHGSAPTDQIKSGAVTSSLRIGQTFRQSMQMYLSQMSRLLGENFTAAFFLVAGRDLYSPFKSFDSN